MSNDPLFIAILVALGGVALIVFLGIGRFGRGRAEDRIISNKLMQMRIIAQAVAVVLILLFIWLRGAN